MKNKKPSVVNIISFVNKSNAFEWVISGLKNEDYHLVFILLHYEETPLENFLIEQGITVYRVHYTGKKTLPGALLKVMRLLNKERADVVHCHLFDACIIGLFAAKVLGVRKRVYTRHNSTIHHVYFPKAVKYDRFINYLSTHIIAISNKVKEVLVKMEQVPEKKVHIVPHGFDFSFFSNIDQSRIEHLFEKHSFRSDQKPVIGVVSRYIHWKGIQYIIPAFKSFLQTYPDAILILANASGPYQKELKHQLQQELPEDSYREIAFEDDIIALYKTFDAFIHVPIDDHSEAFGQVYVEALASGVPSIFTLSGIAIEFIKHEGNALVVDFKNEVQIHEGLIRLFQDQQLNKKLVDGGIASVRQFDIRTMIDQLNNIYKD